MQQVKYQDYRFHWYAHDSQRGFRNALQKSMLSAAPPSTEKDSHRDRVHVSQNASAPINPVC